MAGRSGRMGAAFVGMGDGRLVVASPRATAKAGDKSMEMAGMVDVFKVSA